MYVVNYLELNAWPRRQVLETSFENEKISKRSLSYHRNDHPALSASMPAYKWNTWCPAEEPDCTTNEPCQVSCPEIMFGCCQTIGREACSILITIIAYTTCV